jgi:hypothetical protein
LFAIPAGPATSRRREPVQHEHRQHGHHHGGELRVLREDQREEETRPVRRLVGYAKARLGPGAAARVTFEVPAAAAAFTGLAGRRIVEPGDLELHLVTSSAVVREVVALRLTGPEVPVEPNGFAAVCPAPFFDTEVPLPPGESLTYCYRVTIADGDPAGLV